MPVKGTKNGQSQPKAYEPLAIPDDLPDDLKSSFGDLGEDFKRAFGPIVARACVGGGYVGFSVSDDGDSCKLVVRTARFAIEKRCYSVKQLDSLCTYVWSKLTNA